MPKIFYSNALIDLSENENIYWNKIDARTEIRLARKHTILIKKIEDKDSIFNEAREILKETLAAAAVPYDKIFDSIILDKKNIFLAAIKENNLVSFIVITEKKHLSSTKRTAFLELSATRQDSKKFCPNYLLIWEATVLLRSINFSFFNLGLLGYENCPDPDLKSVAFFKQKWATSTEKHEENLTIAKYIYLRFLKRYRVIKQLLYWLYPIF